ncbi:hypothetical protein AALN28_19305 [Bacteroides xylanisolvens]|uniref:hypothetical protein n=1 Tax=Bacteroides xylanisolvens TaxID=371601 RepID=UPI003511130E
MKTIQLALLGIIISAGAILDSPKKKSVQNNTFFREYKDTVLQNKYSTIIMGRFIENDTTVILKEYDKKNGKQCLNTIIYIEPNKNSIYYKEIAQPIFLHSGHGQYDLDAWRKYRLEKQKTPLSNIDLSGLPTDWIPLHSYKNHYYVFKPCEIDVPFRRCLTDSTLAYYSMEFYFNAIQKLEKKSNSLYHIELESQDESSLSPTQIYIHIIDRQKKVAIWEYRKENNSEYELMIPIESAKYFDMLVCHTFMDKFFYVKLLKFDEIDFKTLLKQKTL